MSSAELDAIVNEYFRRLDALLVGLPAVDREPLVAEIRAHVSEARAGLPVENETAIREVLERVGDPKDIAAEALGDGAKGQRRLGRRATGAAVVVVLAVIAAVLGLLLTGSSAKVPTVIVAPTVSVGGFPTGVAVDTATDHAHHEVAESEGPAAVHVEPHPHERDQGPRRSVVRLHHDHEHVRRRAPEGRRTTAAARRSRR